MAYAATPAATPAADIPAPAEEGKAPPTIDSHGGKLTPLTGSGPDGVSTLLLWLAIIATLVPGQLRAAGRIVPLPMARLLPGLLLSLLATWNLLPALTTHVDPRAQAMLAAQGRLVGLVLGALILMTLAEGLVPTKGVAFRRSLAGLIAGLLGLLLLFATIRLPWYADPPNLGIPLGGLMGLPLGLGLLWLWRRHGGALFSILAITTSLGLVILAGFASPHWDTTAFHAAQISAFTLAALLGSALRGMGRADWQALKGRATWAWSWVLRAFLVTVAVTG